MFVNAVTAVLHRFALSLTILAAAVLFTSTGCESDNAEPMDVLGVDMLQPQQFVNEAASMGLYEVQSAQLVLDRGVGDPARQTALKLVTEHAQMNQQLRELALRNNLAVPAAMNERQAQWFRQLQETQTPALASRFHDQQIQAHTQAIELFERAARELESEEMRNFAQQSLPHLRDHLALLRTHSHGTLP